jgi:SagB-type dehydrogenase family enzyme
MQARGRPGNPGGRPGSSATSRPMNASDAAALHERTKHTWQRIRAESHSLDWGNHPFPFKIYPDLEPLPLPRQLPDSGVPATQVLSGQVSVSASALDLAGLARLLFFAAGVTRILHGVLFRAAPSAGALYPTELYAVCGPLAELPAGVYHFEPAEFALRRLRDGDFRARLAAAAAEPAIAGLPLCLVLTGIPWRTTWKYRERGYRHLFWDAGAIVANLLAVAAAAGWDARVLVGFVDQQVAALLGHQMGVQPVAVERGPAAVRTLSGVLHQDMRVELRIAGAAEAVLERDGEQPAAYVVAVGAVVVAAHPDPVGLQVVDADVEGLGPGLGDLPAELLAAAGGQQRYALRRAEAVVEGLHPLVDPLAAVLPGPLERLAIQLPRVGAEDLAAEPLDRLDLHPPGAAELACCLDRADVALERLRLGELLQVLDAVLGGAGREGLQQRPGGQLGARIGAPQRRTPHLAGGGIQALEHRPHLLGRRDPLQPAGLGGAADEPAW